MQYQFTLQYLDGYLNEVVEVEEPKGFSDGFNSKLERDIDFHGVFFMLSSENITLEFAEQGRQIFKQAKEEKGFDFIVILNINRRAVPTDPFETVYIGRAITEELSFDRDYARVSFQETNALIDINNNKDLEVDATSAEDVSGNAITAASSEDIRLKGRQIRAIWGLSSSTGGINLDVDTTTGTDISTIPNELDSRGSEIQYESGKKGYRVNQLSQGIDTSFPNRYFFGGQLLVAPDGYFPSAEFEISGDFTKTETGTYVSGGVTLYLVEIEIDPDGVDTTTYSYTQIQRVDTGDADGSFSLTKTITPVNGKEIYVGLATEADLVITVGVQFVVDFEIGTGGFDLTAETSFPETTATGYKFFDILKHNLEVITGDDILCSSYLDGGTLDLLYESNGWQLRSFTNPVIGSFSQRMNSLKSAFNLGYGLEQEKYTDSEKIVVEPMSYFYRDVELIAFTEVEGDTYREDPSDSFLFNKIDLGFAKDSTGENVPGSSEDVHTNLQAKTPVNQLQDSYSWISEHIASDIVIELIRRENIRKRPNESTDYDDDLFLLDCIDDSGIELAYNFDKGLQSTGITNFDTSSNGRFNLRFNMFNHGITTNTTTEGKETTDLQRINKYRQAKGLDKRIVYTNTATDTTLGDPSQFAPPALGAPTLDGSAQIGEFTTLLKPNEITFRVGLLSSELQLILDAHKNVADQGNYGYITIINPLGETKQGWLLSMTYTEVDKIAEITLIEKA